MLICHTRYRINNPDYFDVLRYLADSEKVIFSTDPLSHDEYPSMVHSADVGIAFYEEQSHSRFTQDNIRYVGRSSGKIAYYLMMGLPVVVNNWSNVGDMILRFQCGWVVENPLSTREALEHIFANIETYRSNTQLCFAQEFDFKAGFTNLVKRIKAF